MPTPIALPGPAQRVAVGESSAYVLLEDGSVVAWGENDEGQLGNGPSGSNRPLGTYPKPSVTPVRVTDLADIIAIEAGRKHAIALRKDGTVWAWGVRDDGAIGDGDAQAGREPARGQRDRARRGARIDRYHADCRRSRRTTSR